MKWVLTVLVLLLVPSLLWAANINDTRQWWGRPFTAYVDEGCAPTVPASSLTIAAFACTAFVKEGNAWHGIDQPAVAVTIADATPTWLAIRRSMTATCPGGWTCVAQSHYLFQQSASQPANPTGGLVFARVDVAASVISAISLLGLKTPVPLDQISPWLDVRQHGAQCDGTTDDTQAFLRAITQNKPMLVPAGTCIIDTLALANGTQFVMRGAGVGRTILQHKAPATGEMFDQTTAGESLDYFYLADLSVDGDDDNQTNWELDVVAVRVDHALIENVEFFDSKRAAVFFPQINNLAIIRDSWFRDMSIHGGTAGQETMAVRVDKDNITGSAANSLFVMTGNKIEQTTAPTGAGNSSGGLLIVPDDGFPQHALVTGNDFVNIGQEIAGNIIAPIDCYRECDHSIIAHNKIRNLYTQGIMWQRSSNVQIVHNRLEGEGDMVGGRYGIGAANRSPNAAKSQMLIQGNIITGTTADHCIRAFWNNVGTEFSDLDISGNLCQGAEGGIQVRGVGGSVKILNNRIKTLTAFDAAEDAAINIDQITSAAIIRIAHNEITDTQERAIVIDDGTARTVELSVHNNHFENTCQGLAATAGIVTVGFLDRFEMHGNVYKTPNCRPYDINDIADVRIYNNIAPAGQTVTNGANTGSSRLLSYHNYGWDEITVTFADQDATPSVARGELFLTANTIATTITGFDDISIGDSWTVRINDGNTTIDCSASSILCNAGVDITADDEDALMCVSMDGTNSWCTYIND